MPENKDVDPFELARQAREAGVAKLRELRDRHARELAERVQIEEQHRAERETAEALFAAAEAEAVRLERLATARSGYDAALATYKPLADEADTLVAKLHTAIADVTRLFGDAAIAERARDTAGKPLKAAHEVLRNHDDHAPNPHIAPLRLHRLSPTDPVGQIGRATTLLDDRFANERADLIAELEQRPIRPSVTINRR